MQKLNPTELQIDLFCKGIRIGESCALDDDARIFARTRAGLGSGLELNIPTNKKKIWLNVPVEEDFAQKSPYELVKSGSGYQVLDTRNDMTYDVEIPSAPKWYGLKTTAGASMARVGVLQGTYLGIYIGKPCTYWETNENCRFCTTGLNVGTQEEIEKRVDDVVETALAAKEESGITFVHFNSGFQGARDVETAAPYVKAVMERVGALVGVQCIPTDELWKYDWLMDCGADHFSFCYEFHNPEYFEKLLPGKQRTLGQKTFFKALEYTSKKMGKGRVSGEIIAGVEPIEDTLDAIDYITSLGAFPTVCIFRPVCGSDMQDYPSPTYEDMRVVFKRVYDGCKRNGIPVGATPNIEVSLVVQPDDCTFLADRDMSYYWFEFKRGLVKKLAYPYFMSLCKPRKTKGSLEPDPKQYGAI